MFTSWIFPYATRCDVTRDVSNCKTIRYYIFGVFDDLVLDLVANSHHNLGTIQNCPRLDVLLVTAVCLPDHRLDIVF